MRKIPIVFVFFFLLIIIQNLYAQKVIQIIDKNTNQPVSDVYLYYKVKSSIQIISYTDSGGRLIIPAGFKTDTFYLSNINYLTKTITNAMLDTASFVALDPIGTVLDSVMINAFKVTNTKEFGYYRYKGKKYLASSLPGWILGTIIDIDTNIKKYKITKLFVKLHKENLVEQRNSTCKAGLIFYFLYAENNRPTSIQIIDPVIVDYNKLREKFSIEIPFSPVLNNISGSIFIGMEWQNLQCNSTLKQFDLPFISTDTDNKVWVYSFQMDKWMESFGLLRIGKAPISIDIQY